MASQSLSLSHQQSVADRRQRAVADIQLAATGMERQGAGHGMDGTVKVTERAAQQQHASAFGIDRSTARETPQGIEAAMAAAQLGRMLFRKATGKDQTSGVLR